jgi:hypothetical protein
MNVPFSFWMTSRGAAETAITPPKTMSAANGTVLLYLNIIISSEAASMERLDFRIVFLENGSISRLYSLVFREKPNGLG